MTKDEEVGEGLALKESTTRAPLYGTSPLLTEPPADGWRGAIHARLVVTYEGLKKNLIPAVVLQIVALAVVLGYFYIDAVREALDQIAQVKREYGYLFSCISTATFGGLIPWAVISFKTIFTDGVHEGETGKMLRQGLFYILCFAERGVEVDAFYRLQAYLFGDGNDVKTIVSKVLLDQFGYCAFVTTPINMLLLGWKDGDFSFTLLRQQLNWSFITFRWPCGLVSAWMVWIPAVTLVYCLPSALQIPLFNLVLCFFVLLLSFVSQRATQQKRADDYLPIADSSKS